MQTTTSHLRVLAPDEGEAIWFLGHVVTIKTIGEETNETFSVTEHYPPTGFGPPPHIHHNEDEAIYVLEGEIAGFAGETTFRGVPGSYLFLPRDVVHSWKVEGGTPARLLIVTAPAGFEHFIRDSGVPAENPKAPPRPATEVEIEKMLTAATRYGIEILPPPE